VGRPCRVDSKEYVGEWGWINVTCLDGIGAALVPDSSLKPTRKAEGRRASRGLFPPPHCRCREVDPLHCRLSPVNIVDGAAAWPESQLDTSGLKATLTSPARWLPVLLLWDVKWVRGYPSQAAGLIPTKHTGPVARLDLRQCSPCAQLSVQLRWRRSSTCSLAPILTDCPPLVVSNKPSIALVLQLDCLSSASVGDQVPSPKTRPTDRFSWEFLGHSEVRPHPRDLSVQLPTVVEN
jgi:hypothetical protein